MHPKTDRQRELLKEAVRNVLLFRNLDDEQRMTVINAMVEKQVEPGTFDEREAVTYLYIVCTMYMYVVRQVAIK